MLPAPELNDSRTFKWIDTNQFDINDYKYRNDYDRREIAFGFRPTFYYGGDPAPSMKDVSLKDGPMPAERRAAHAPANGVRHARHGRGGRAFLGLHR